MTVTKDWTDQEGIKRKMLLPDDGYDPVEGIPVSLSVDELYPYAPLEFKRALMEELWNRGLVLPEDFLKPGSSDGIRAALLSVLKRDVMDIMTLAKEKIKNGRQ